MLDIKELMWDERNRAHIARHGVTPDEVAQICQGEFAVRESHTGRFMIIGQTQAGRVLAVVLHPRSVAIFYVVTARIADKKERMIYTTEIEKGGEQAA